VENATYYMVIYQYISKLQTRTSRKTTSRTILLKKTPFLLFLCVIAMLPMPSTPILFFHWKPTQYLNISIKNHYIFMLLVPFFSTLRLVSSCHWLVTSLLLPDPPCPHPPPLLPCLVPCRRQRSDRVIWIHPTLSCMANVYYDETRIKSHTHLQ